MKGDRFQIDKTRSFLCVLKLVELKITFMKELEGFLKVFSKGKKQNNKTYQLPPRNIVAPSPQLNTQWIWSNTKQKEVKDTHPEFTVKLQHFSTSERRVFQMGICSILLLDNRNGVVMVLWLLQLISFSVSHFYIVPWDS